MKLDKSSTRPVHLTINVNIFGSNVEEEGNEELMAKIDELQASFDGLDRAVRDFMAEGAPNVDALQQELEQLRQDDAVEDTKLDGLKNGVDNLKQAVDNLRNASGGDQPHPDQTLPGDLPPA